MPIRFNIWMRHASKDERAKLATSCGLKISTLWAMAGKHRNISDVQQVKIQHAIISINGKQICFSEVLPAEKSFLYQWSNLRLS